MPYADALQFWLALPDLAEKDRAQLEACGQDADALEAAFGQPLSFGTAGLRGKMGPGPGQMNAHMVAWTTAGLAQALQKQGHDKGPIVIARDSRHQSDEFAQTTARVLVAYGFQPLYWQAPTPTPALSWSVRAYGAVAGIMITASHNPAPYNGYKVYDHTGGQILAPQAQAVSVEVSPFLNGQKSLPPLAPFADLVDQGDIECLDNTALEAYLAEVWQVSEGFRLPVKDPSPIVFSPLHGTGSPAGPRLLRQAGFEVWEVADQSDFNGDFPTVTKPNPEDPAAFALAEALGQAKGADLLLLTDPDADRLGAAVAGEGGYVLLSGNQMAALMIDFLSHALDRREGLVITSTVSSPFAKVLAKKRGLQVTETLTGFKYIADRMTHPHPEDPAFFFAFEESNGFLFGDYVRDKDGIMAALVMASAHHALAQEGKSLLSRLEELYAITGTYEDRLVNLDLAAIGGRQAGLARLEGLRQAPPTQIAGIPVKEVKDYGPGLGDLPPENMIQFDMEDGSVLALRPSGTEPLLKCYINARGLDASQARTVADAYAQAFAKRIGQP